MDAESRSETDAGPDSGAPLPEQPQPEAKPPYRSPDTGVLTPAAILAVAGILALIVGGFGILGTALALSGAAFLALAFRRPEAAAPLRRLWDSTKGRKVFLAVVGVAFLLGAFTGGGSKDFRIGYVQGYSQSRSHGGQISLDDFMSNLAASYGVSEGEVEELMTQMMGGGAVKDPGEAFDGFRAGYKDFAAGKDARWTRKDIK